METIIEREYQFTEKARTGIAVGLVHDITEPGSFVGGWSGVVRATRHEAMFGVPEEVFSRHSQILGTEKLLLVNPHLWKAGYTKDQMTLKLVLEVLRGTKAVFEDINKKGEVANPFEEHFNFMMDAVSSEAIARSLQRMQGYPFNLNNYQATVDEQCKQLWLPKPDIGTMFGELIQSFGVNVCSKYCVQR